MPASGHDRDRRVAWVVDDSALEAEIARRTLATDYDVEVFNDGSALLERLSSGHPPDVIVLDWTMPGISGIEVCRFLRSRPETSEMGVLLLTVHQQTEQVVEGLAAGANDYLIKPYAPPVLNARVASLIRSRILRERAARAEMLLRTVLTQLPDAVVTVDGDAKILFVNAAAERILGGEGASLIGQNIADIVPGLPLRRLITAEQQPACSDVQIGDQIYAPHLSIAPSDDEGKTTISLRNVTVTRRLEARRLDFYSMVAHDLRSPLSTIQLRTQMMLKGLRGGFSQAATTELTKMNRSVDDMVQMINDFLEIAQLEGGGFQLEKNLLSATSVVSETMEEFRPLAEAKGIALGPVQTDGATLVVGDRRRLAQVISNLFSNAIKFSAAGGKVSARITAEKDCIETVVQDEGAGIAAAAQAALFRKYSRLAQSGPAVQGTGLGLMIVREIVEAHGGTVGVRSSPGSGSSFWFRLPRAEAATGATPVGSSAVAIQ
jgi:two-component system phosphate regulon sensor histidine kinase PhoR